MREYKRIGDEQELENLRSLRSVRGRIFWSHEQKRLEYLTKKLYGSNEDKKGLIVQLNEKIAELNKQVWRLENEIAHLQRQIEK